MYYLGDKGLNYKLCKKHRQFQSPASQTMPCIPLPSYKTSQGPSHTLQSPSSLEREVCNKLSISQTCHHGYQHFVFYALWKPIKCTLQDLLHSQIILKQLNFTLPLRELSLTLICMKYFCNVTAWNRSLGTH